MSTEKAETPCNEKVGAGDTATAVHSIASSLRMVPGIVTPAAIGLIDAAPDLLAALIACEAVLAAEGGHSGGAFLDEVQDLILRAGGQILNNEEPGLISFNLELPREVTA